jgi:hypothetical protein
MLPAQAYGVMKSGGDCACAHFDRCECANIRMRRIDGAPRYVEEWDPCDCSCHDDYDEEQDEEDFAADV